MQANGNSTINRIRDPRLLKDLVARAAVSQRVSFPVLPYIFCAETIPHHQANNSSISELPTIANPHELVKAHHTAEAANQFANRIVVPQTQPQPPSPALQFRVSC